MASERVAAGFQLGFHAIGDRAAQMALDAFAEATSNPHAHAATGATTPRDFRFRIEHDQVIAPDQFAQYKKLGVIASVQPSHLLTDMNWAVERIGPERAKTSYPWKQFLDNGVPLAFGTDYPVEPINPFRGIYAAVTRKNEAGTKEYYPEQKLTIQQALAAYTTGSAYAQFAETDEGNACAGHARRLCGSGSRPDQGSRLRHPENPGTAHRSRWPDGVRPLESAEVWLAPVQIGEEL